MASTTGASRARAPAALSPPYADQAAAGRFYGLRIVATPDGRGPIIAHIDVDLPAAKAGLSVGDVVAVLDAVGAGVDRCLDALHAGGVNGDFEVMAVSLVDDRRHLCRSESRFTFHRLVQRQH